MHRLARISLTANNGRLTWGKAALKSVHHSNESVTISVSIRHLDENTSRMKHRSAVTEGVTLYFGRARSTLTAYALNTQRLEGIPRGVTRACTSWPRRPIVTRAVIHTARKPRLTHYSCIRLWTPDKTNCGD